MCDFDHLSIRFKWANLFYDGRFLVRNMIKKVSVKHYMDPNSGHFPIFLIVSS